MKGPKKETTALIFASLTWFLVLAGRRGVSTLLIEIEDTFAIDHAQAGLALTAMWFFYGIMQFPSGIVSDIKGRKKTIIVSIIIFSGAYILIGGSFNYFLFIGALIMVGIGAGSYPTAGISMLTDLYREKRGRALGIQSSFGSMAGLVPIIAPLIAILNWRIFFFLCGGAGIVIAICFFRKGSESTTLPESVSIPERLWDGIRTLGSRRTFFIFIVNILTVFCWMGFTSFFPAYLIEVKSYTTVEAGLAYAVLLLGGIILKPLMGGLSDRRSKKAVMLLILSIAGTFTVLVVTFDSLLVIMIFSIMLSGTASFFLVANSYLLQKWEERGRGGKLGFFRSTTVLIGSPTSALIGYSATRWGFDIAYTGIAILFLISSTLLAGSLVWGLIKKRS